MSINEVIIAEDVSKEYRRGHEIIVAIKKLNLKIKRGEFFVIAGPSGSGKTTLLNILSGLDKPTTGRIILDGLDTNMIDEKQFPKIRRERVGFIFQNWNLIDGFTAIENVEAAMWPSELSNKVIEERALTLLRMVDLIERKDHRPKELSGGEQQKALLCHALCREPQLLLLDEPFVNLDITSQKEFLRLIEKVYKEKNLTIILVTHLFHLIPRSCKRVILLDKGKVLFDGERDVFFSTL